MVLLIIVLVVFLILIVIALLDGASEYDVLIDAERFIEDHCNESHGCPECDRYIKDKSCCKYQLYPPWQWRKEEE